MNNKISVSERAVIQRINRKLRPHDEMLRKSRGGRAMQSVGDYYVVNFDRNYIAQQDVDVEGLARELAVLKPWEKVTWDE